MHIGRHGPGLVVFVLALVAVGLFLLVPRAAEDWTIRVRVEDDAGRPFPRTAVTGWLWAGDNPRFERVTDDAGRFVLGPYRAPLPPKGLDLHVETDTHEIGFAPARPAEGGAPRLDGVAILEAKTFLSGRVVLPEGVPPSAAVAWVRSAGPRYDSHYGIQGGERLTLGPDLSFRLEYPFERAGIVEVTVAHEGRRWYGNTRVEGPTDGVAVGLRPIRPGDPALLHVVVEGRADAPPTMINGLHGLARDGRALYGVTAPRGEHEDAFEMFWWEPGASLVLDAHVYESGRTRSWQALVGPFSSGVTRVRVAEPARHVLRGKVLFEDGRPSPGVKVGLEALLPLERSYRTEATHIFQATTDASGRFEIEGLGPYRHEAKVELEGDAHVASVVTVEPQQREIELVVRAAPPVRLRVVDTHGRPVEGLQVTVSAPPPGVTLDRDALPLAPYGLPGEFREVAEEITDAEGSGVLRGLDPLVGHRVEISGGADTLSLEIQGWRPTDETFVAEPGAWIEGRVVGEDGEPVQHALVQARGLDDLRAGRRRYRRYRGGTYDEPISDWTAWRRHTFKIGPLPPGRYEVWVLGSEGRVVAEAGQEDVELVGSTLEEDTWTFHVEGWRPEDRGAWALFTSTEERPRRARVDGAGYALFVHAWILPGRDFWIGGLPGGRYVWGRSVEGPESMLEVQQGGTIRGEVRVPSGLDLDRLEMAPLGPILCRDDVGRMLGACSASADAAAGTFEIRGVPPGRWTVRVTGSASGRTLRGEARARPGERVVVTLRETE